METQRIYMDLYTAWYAASLVNKMVAIEQGVTLLAVPNAIGAAVKSGEEGR
jgi:hypothetical protein